MNLLQSCRKQLGAAELHTRIGHVRRISGLLLEAEGPYARLGELCHVARADRGSVLAEVVGLQRDGVHLMAYDALDGIVAGAQVVAIGQHSGVPVGRALLGRVIDGFGQALDGRAAPATTERSPLHVAAHPALLRPRIDRVLETGVRAIDALLTIGHGQRVGIFAGSGVGKSTLLGMMARHVQADVNVIALVGERGREVREFIDKHLRQGGLARSVVVVATSDQPALARLRAAHAAMAIARWFADQGGNVLLTLDSMTRLAMARREIGLAAGEPATARGYTPSVFAELPRMCERAGTCPGGGSVTALMTVLVEGDDLNEPVSDSLRAVLDGHIVLSRELAHQGQFPAIDVLRSASRLLPDLASPQERALAADAVRLLAVLERSRDLVDIGAYQPGNNVELDASLPRAAPLQGWLRQAEGGVPRSAAVAALAALLRAEAP
jgi:flagellum-specific ATP synthase